MNAPERLQWEALNTGLAQLRSGALSAHGLSDLARSQHALLDALGPRYREVLLQLMDRLESSALFSEESCSFSQQGLLDNLQIWLEKASAQLGATPPDR